MAEKEFIIRGNKTKLPSWKDYYPMYSTNSLTQKGKRKNENGMRLPSVSDVISAKNDTDEHQM